MLRSQPATKLWIEHQNIRTHKFLNTLLRAAEPKNMPANEPKTSTQKSLKRACRPTTSNCESSIDPQNATAARLNRLSNAA